MAECELDGHEAGINNLLEHLYLDSNREYQHDFGPRVHEGPVRRRNTVRQSFIPRDGTARRPEAMLIAQLASHTDAVTAFAVSPDHLFFVSTSDDKTVKVWDTARLERNVTSKPRFSYAQHQAKIKAVCMLEGVHCFASAADDGSLHVVRVHVSQGGALPRYTKINAIREHRTSRPGEYITCMAHYDSGAPVSLHSRTLLMFYDPRIGIQSCVCDNTLDNMPSGFTHHAGSTHYGTSKPQWTHYRYVSGSKTCLGSYRDGLWCLDFVGHPFWFDDKDLENCLCRGQRFLSNSPMCRPSLSWQRAVDYCSDGDRTIDFPE